MAVTATFVADLIEVLPNVSATLTLRLYSDDPVTRDVTITLSGDLSDHVKLDASAAILETNQIVDIPVTVFAPSTVEAGTYTIDAKVHVGAMQPTPELARTQVEQSTSSDMPAPALADASTAEATVVAASATVVVAAHSEYTIALHPTHSKGSSTCRHVVRVANTGNVSVQLDVSAEQVGDDISIDPEQTTLIVPPGAARDTSLRVTPARRYWSGPRHDHGFVVHTTSTDGRSDELVANYQQRPRVPSWLGPAAAGAFAALLVGAVAWFALLRPWVQDTADQAAADAIEQDRAALRERIDELEVAAAEAEELPLGSPFDVRLDVNPAGGNVEQATTSAAPGMVVSITDVVFQNPTGAVGTVSLRRDDEVVLRSELANFRDFDLHFVAPYVFDDGVEIVFEVECRTPGAGQSTCPIGVSLVGFVDEDD